MDKTIVVLPLDATKTAGKMSQEARISLEEQLRDEAANALSGSGWTVMTGETTLKILTDNGIDPGKCGEGSCHLDTAKSMNVEKFISGAVQYSEGGYTASVRLIDTKSGNILASARLESDTVRGLRKDFATKAEKFFEHSGLLDGSAPAATVAPAQGGATPAGPGHGTLKVVSSPQGAKVSIDGDAAGTTPLTLKREAGTYVVSIELSGYAPASRQVELMAGKAAVVNETLMQAAGYIEVSVAPEPAARSGSVTVDGKPAGVGKQGPYKVGKHAVRAEAAGYKPAEQQTDVDNGGTTQAALTLEALPGKLLLSVNVAADCSAGGASVHASPEGVTKLEVAAGSVRVTCSAEGHEDATADVEVGPGKARPVKLALSRVQGPRAGQVEIEPNSGLPFVYIPAGSFHYGCEPQDPKCNADEKPGHSANVSAFWLGKTDVTVAAYAKCAASGACERSIQTRDAAKRVRGQGRREPHLPLG